MKSSRYAWSRRLAARGDDPDGQRVALGEDPAVTARASGPSRCSTRPAQSSATVVRHRDLRLQAEVDLVDLHPDVRAYPAGAAVRADDRARQHRLAVG